MLLRSFCCLLFFCFLPVILHAAPSEQGGTDPTVQIDRLVEGAIARGAIAGGVVLVGNGRETLFERAYGRTSLVLDAGPVLTDTIFDLASLTKVLATTPAILKLAEERRLSLVDPVTKWLPEFAGKGKDELLILHLLTHTSGLDDFSFKEAAPRQSAIAGAAAERLKGEIGSRFHYADINFILLGEIISRVTGEELDRYAAKTFYQPLGMSDTGFRPTPDKATRCAPTLSGENAWLTGLPQDYPARQLGGVAGHAGVFSTARDLGTFCRMLLHEGEWLGKRVLAPRTVRQMTAPYFSRGGRVMRGLGWDMASPFSSPKGNGFSEVSFGHTGYSGSSLWIDPEANLFVVLLTTRLEYKKLSEISQLRAEVSSLAAKLFAPATVAKKEAAVPSLRAANTVKYR
ncbi:MAG TPA: serine hydrolase domain-containing protein [Geobacteraceae bacterium]